MIKARIIITAFNSHYDLNKCIESLQSQSCKDFEVIIVNNSSESIAYNSNRPSFDWLTILQSDQNTGFAGGSNLGAQGAKTEWIITLNPDAWPERDWFANLMMAADKHPHYDMLSSTLVKADTPDRLDGAGDCYSICGIGWRGGQDQSLSLMPSYYRDVLAPCGAAAAYRREVFVDNGGFDSMFFCYLEDLDLALRLQSRDHKCLHVYDAYVRHVGGGSTGINSAFQLYHTHKNQLRLMAKTAPFLVLLIQLPLYCITQVYLLIRAFGTPCWRSKLRGLKEGVISFPKIFFTERGDLQRRRKISTLSYAKLLTWSLQRLRRKAL